MLHQNKSLRSLIGFLNNIIDIKTSNELKEFESVNELNSFIKALENSFIIDENLSINKAVELLWTFRNIDLSNVQKFTTPVDYLTLNDGRQVLVLNDTIHNFLKKNSVIDS